jgi:hypothetical protein
MKTLAGARLATNMPRQPEALESCLWEAPALGGPTPRTDTGETIPVGHAATELREGMVATSLIPASQPAVAFSLRLMLRTALLTVALGLALCVAGGMMHLPFMEVPNNGTEANFATSAQGAQGALDSGVPKHDPSLEDRRAIPHTEFRQGARVGLGLSDQSVRPHHPPVAMQSLFDAIRQVESQGNDRAVGDGNRSKGPYQCGRAAWEDGGGDPARYDRLVWNRAATERVMLAYWQRYGAVTDEQKARCWNSGPKWRDRYPLTDDYWRRVQKVMER